MPVDEERDLEVDPDPRGALRVTGLVRLGVGRLVGADTVGRVGDGALGRADADRERTPSKTRRTGGVDDPEGLLPRLGVCRLKSELVGRRDDPGSR